jgi:tripartite-type tricarboxylate transporter receptor subunit TctC
MEAFLSMAELKMTHVPYKGTGPVIPDLVSGRVHLSMASPPSVQQLVLAGRLRGLAITGTTRAATLPEVPTFAEAGFPQYDMSTWFGVFGPARMPAALVARLNSDINALMRDPALGAKLSGAGIDVAGGLTPAQVLDYMASEAVKWNAAARAAGMR